MGVRQDRGGVEERRGEQERRKVREEKRRREREGTEDPGPEPRRGKEATLLRAG